MIFESETVPRRKIMFFKGSALFFLSFMIILCLVPSSTKKVRRARMKTDAFSKTRCDLRCEDLERSQKADCRFRCKSEESKPGTCPSTDSPQWATACVRSCAKDKHCEGTAKCCQLGCGAACSEPIDLLTLPGLPAVPVIGDIKEKRRSTIVTWSDGVGDSARSVPGRIIYLLQEQHMLGPKYEEAKLGEWNLVLRSNKTKASLHNLTQPGRWYRFRVAAVSAVGTRGYSVPSAAFTPRKGPRPPSAPRRLRVKAVHTNNGTITARVEWREPRSELPIMRYKVFWSRRLRGVTGELNSVLVNHHIVHKDQTSYEIADLQPNSTYFIQVQTISQFGTSKLRSEKAAVLYNTSATKEQKAPEALRSRGLRAIRSLKLDNVIWNNHDIRARIHWSPNAKNDTTKRYLVRWKIEQCYNKQQKSKELSATTEQTTFDIYELKYGCVYRVGVDRPSTKSRRDPDSELLVAVPKCEHFQKKVKNLKC